MPKMNPDKRSYALGLDLGTSSIGAFIVYGRYTGGKFTPEELGEGFTRIFPEGMDRSRGEKSLNQDRRLARGLRRQGFRRVRRKQKLLHALQDAELLPRDEQALTELMRRENPYELRARALDEKLDDWQVGRALYHLGQRRGFLSNRKAGNTNEDGKVATGISELEAAMQHVNAETLGAYLHGLDKQQQRVRGRYTSRAMYQHEFSEIWKAQEKHHSGTMSAANMLRIQKAIFDQRPLKTQKFLIGSCDFEPDRKRAAKATLVAQEFRLWQSLNSLKVLFADNEERFLSDKERSALHEKLSHVRSLSWEKIKQTLDFPDSAQFNLEKMRKSGLQGNETAAIVGSAIGKKFWQALGERGRESLVFDLLNIEQEHVLQRRLRKRYGLPEESVDKVVSKSMALPKGHIHLSGKAARKILAELRRMATAANQGLSYAQACAAAGYDHVKALPKSEKNQLPFPGIPAKDKHYKTFAHDPEKTETVVRMQGLRNPMVERAIYQLRRMVNAIVRDYGKPAVIRVEMARDLKSNAKQREEYQRRQRLNEEANQRAETALREFGIPSPSRADKIKYRLWEECGHTCPYSGKAINFDGIFGSHPQFDVEHIIPYSRCLDDGWMNKTLCYREENERKGNLTPWEFYHSDPETYALVLQRAKKLPYPKFRRFSKDAIKNLDDFVSQQLNETRYISRKAVEYLQQLGSNVESVKGGTTALLRHAWGLNRILSDSGAKERMDHRHHAVDALVCALTDRAAVKALSDKAAVDSGRLSLRNYPQPLRNLRKAAEPKIMAITVSHKILRDIRGPLHDETLYGTAVDGGKPIAVVRMKLADLNEKDIFGTGRKRIRDPRIRELAKRHLERHGNIKKAFANAEDPFGFTLPNGDFRKVEKVRILTDRTITRIGKEHHRQRHVWTRNNHHIEILESTGKDGQHKWRGRVINMLEAIRRNGVGDSVIRKTSHANERFVMALHQNDMVLLDHEGERVLCRVEKMDQNKNLSFRRHNDADKTDWKRAIRKNPETLRKANARLVHVNVLGEIRGGND